MFNSNLNFGSGARYLVYGASAIIMFGIGFLGWAGYNLYVTKLEQYAFSDLSEGINEFNKYITSGKSEEGEENKLNDLENIFSTAVHRHSKSKLLPYFYLYESDALIQKGDLKKALEILDKAIKAIDKSNPFYYLFLSKRALMKLDMQEYKEPGLSELNSLALDPQNPFFAMAGYYLGLYYFNANDFTHAKDVWQRVLDNSKNDCNWCEQISTRLKNIA